MTGRRRLEIIIKKKAKGLSAAALEETRKGGLANVRRGRDLRAEEGGSLSERGRAHTSSLYYIHSIPPAVASAAVGGLQG